MVDGRRFMGFSKGFPAPPLPDDFAVRLGRLEDRSGLPLEEFTFGWGIPPDRAKAWRTGDPPSDQELRSIMEWACEVEGGVAVLLRDTATPWPYRTDA